METRNNYIEENLKLVWKEVHRQIGESSPIDKDDAFQEGVLAMIIALERFDPSKGAKKSTYITNFVKGYIQMLNRDITSAHIPLRVITKAQEIDKRGLHHLSIAKLADTLKTTYETAAAALFFSVVDKQLFFSLDTSSEEYYAPTYEFEHTSVLRQLLDSSMDCLTNREKEVITLLYFGGCNYIDAAKVLNLNKETIRQTDKRALKKLRKKIGGELSDYIA